MTTAPKDGFPEMAVKLPDPASVSEEEIARALKPHLESVCSDGNSDAAGVAHYCARAVLALINHKQSEGWRPIETRRIIDAAREWLVERAPRDRSEKTLAVAIVRAFPEELRGKEYCTCGEQDQCDECPTTAQVEEIARGWERDIAPPPQSNREGGQQ